MRGRFVLLGVAVLMAEGAAVAQCRPGYVGSGYYRSSDCHEYLIPKAYPFGGDILSPFVGPMFVPGPFSYGYPLVLPPQIPGSYFRPWYFEPPQPYSSPGNLYDYGFYPPGQVPSRARPRRMHPYQSGHRGLRGPVRRQEAKPNGRIVQMGNGVWANE